ncbi:restriction endonuclease subunit S [Paenibacillus sp. LX16]|uniref:restriction endonuclease subunit S n=1 Tax=unclassified Paenibacillus TaxID=185978 RepID=UPI002E28D14B|nr:restriction endonuclease subunit S [Paenibacillus sp. LX16]
MSDNIAKPPQIRFAGFTDAWEQRRLGDLLIFSNGINAPKENYGKGRKMISVMDILAKEPLTYEKIRNSVRVDKKIEEKNKVENGDLVFVRSSEISEEVGWAKAYLQDEYALYSGFSIRGKRKNNYDAYFIELSLNNVNRKQIESKAGGSTRFNVSQEILNSIIIIEPSLDEQMKISSLFNHLDNLITLHQRKLELLKDTKKGLLQKMFPKDGADVPEIRFAGFTDAWEQRKLSDVLTERNVQHPQNKNYPLVSFTVEKGVTPKTERYEREQLVVGDKAAKKYKATELNDIVYNPANLKFGAISRNSYGKAVFSPIYVTFEVNDKLAFPSYVEMFVTRQDFVRYSLRYQQGTVYERQSVSPEDLLSLKILLPGKEEQLQIGNFFEQLNVTIALQKRELNSLENLKESLLQQMFI